MGFRVSGVHVLRVWGFGLEEVYEASQQVFIFTVSGFLEVQCFWGLAEAVLRVLGLLESEGF